MGARINTIGHGVDILLRLLVIVTATQTANAFVGGRASATTRIAELSMSSSSSSEADGDRRSFLNQAAAAAVAFGVGSYTAAPQPASATVYLDPALYGDQELRGSAVNSLKESVRRAILQDPSLVTSFYQLAILDGLSYDVGSKEYGPDGRVITAVLSSKDDSTYMKNLKRAAETLIASAKSLKKLTSITIADAVALGGVAAIESVGGPSLSVQLGRLDGGSAAAPLKKDVPPLSPLPLNVLSGTATPAEVSSTFQRSGLTDRELVAILGTLYTLESVQKTRSTSDWKASAKPKFVKPGKMGRASDFKPLTEQDIADMEAEDDDDGVEGDEGWYIAESFGTKDEQFGAKVGGGDISEKNFNKFLKELVTSKSSQSFGWIADLLLDKNYPARTSWVQKYAGSYLSYNKDLGIAYNAVTQLGAEYTGGKYENLLKNKKRKTLNDFD